MFDFITKCRTLPIALDLGVHSVKILQLQQNHSHVSVRACGKWRYPDNVTDPAQRKSLAVGAIRTILKKGNFKGRDVISALGNQALSIKNLRLPHLSGDEMQQALLWEAKERFEFDINTGQMNYLVAGEVRQGTETRDELILLASPQQAVDEHLEIIDEIGLRPLHLDAEPLALFRTFERFLRRTNDEQSISVIVDIGYTSTWLVVARGRQILFIKNIEIGGKKFTEAAASHLNLSQSEAAELRIKNMIQQGENEQAKQPSSNSHSLEWTLHDAVRAEVESLAREIALCLRYCAVTFRGLRCNSVIITGGEAYDSGVGNLLAQGLNCSVSVGHPFKGIDVTCMDIENRRRSLSEWAVATGMAIPLLDYKSLEKEDHGDARLSA